MALPQKLFQTISGTDSGAGATDGVAVSGSSTFYSKVWSGQDSMAYDLQVQWTGTPTGTLTLQVSDKPNPNEANDNDWVTTTETAMVNPAGSASQFRVAYGTSPGKKRLKYVNSSGTGSLFGYVIVPRGVS